ncbi:hypothetical protein HN51_043353 [Arachis hypogaea]
MSTHHILGLKKVPRVRLFADSSGTAGLLSWYGRTAAPREILLYTSSRTRFLNRTSIGERCKHREVRGSLDRRAAYLLSAGSIPAKQARGPSFHQAEARRTILREEGCIPDGYEWREVLLCTADSDPNALGSRATPPRQSLISGETPGVKIWHVSPMLFFVGKPNQRLTTKKSFLLLGGAEFSR